MFSFHFLLTKSARFDVEPPGMNMLLMWTFENTSQIQICSMFNLACQDLQIWGFISSKSRLLCFPVIWAIFFNTKVCFECLLTVCGSPQPHVFTSRSCTNSLSTTFSLSSSTQLIKWSLVGKIDRNHLAFLSFFNALFGFLWSLFFQPSDCLTCCIGQGLHTSAGCIHLFVRVCRANSVAALISYPCLKQPQILFLCDSQRCCRMF